MNKYTVFLGDVALDEYYKVDFWPSIGGKTFVKQLKAQHGGMIANAACVYAALGGNARFMTSLNKGRISKTLIRGLEDCRVKPNYVIWNDSLADSKCIIYLTEDNNTVMIIETGLTTIEISDEYFNVLKNAEYIYSTTSDLLRLRYRGLEGMDIISNLRRCGVKIICDLDTGYIEEDVEDNYKELDIAIFNHIGFNKYKKTRSEEDAISDLLSYGISLVAITYGNKGCKIFTETEAIKAPAYQVEIVDVTGAGDTFSASLLYALQNMNIYDAAKFASATAAICVNRIGARAGMVSEEEVFNFMARKDA